MNLNKIVDRLEDVVGPAGRPTRLSLAIEAELTNFFDFSKLEAAVQAERLEERIASVIGKRIQEANEQGVPGTLTLVGLQYNYVAGSCYVFPEDPLDLATAKMRRLQAAFLLGAMKSLHYSHFERFCARVLVVLGAQNAKTTPHGGDQGIDFYGHLSLGQYESLPAPFMKLAHDVQILFAGQAKHYPDRALGPDIVRQLIGAVSLARSGVFSRDGLTLFLDTDFKPFSPVVILLFTTGTISAGARQLAVSAGITVRSGEQLALFLADHGVGMTDVEGIPQFDNGAFENWITSRN